jgi:DNA-binding MarR family transcriptional regulator
MLPPPSTPASPPPDGAELIDALVQTSFMTMAVLSDVAADHDLSLTQLRVFGILRDRRVGVTDLAEYLGLEKSSMSGLVERAEKRGLVEREPSESDRRGVRISMTAEGRKLAKRVHQRVGEALLPRIEVLGSPERARLAKLLAQLLAADDR